MSAIDPAQRIALIVGAPRAGTTSLGHYLAARDDVCFSSVKEPHFFSQYDLREADDDELRRFVATDYVERYFGGCAPGQYWCESSTTYLFLNAQLAPILKLWPKAKFIVTLRDPIELLPSIHQRLTYQGDENVLDFNRAWDLREERAAGRRIPASCIDPRWLQYGEAGKLHRFVTELEGVVGKERLLVLLFDDLRDDPGGVYRQMLDFLGLPDDGRTDFAQHNPARGFRHGWLQRLLKRPPAVTRSVLAGRQFRQRLKKLDESATKAGMTDPAWVEALAQGRKKLLRWNAGPPRRTPVSPRVKAEIRDTLGADTDALAAKLGRDLSHWLGRQGEQ